MVSLSMTLSDSDPGFKDTVVLKGEYLQSDAFLPRDARSAKRGIAIVSRPSVRPSVCP